MVGALAGYVTSGGNTVNVSQGSSIARGAVMWNRQLHIQEAELIDRYAADFAKEQCDLGNCISEAEAKGLLTEAALFRIDSAFSDHLAPPAYVTDFLDGLSGGTIAGTGGQRYFAATNAERQNHQLNARYLLDTRGLYNLATQYNTGYLNYDDTFTYALGTTLNGGTSADDMATLATAFSALSEAERSEVSLQILTQAPTGVNVSATTQLAALTGQNPNDLLGQQGGIAAQAVLDGSQMLSQIADKKAAGIPLSDDEIWLFEFAGATAFVAQNGQRVLEWSRLAKNPRFRRLVAAGEGSAGQESNGFMGGPVETQTLDPRDIGFSQATVSGKTSDGIPLDELAENMRRDGWQGEPINVVNMPDGVPTSMDNRRLLAARQAGIDVPANVHNASDPLTPVEIDRFSVDGHPDPTTWGEAIQLRIDRQGGMKGVSPSWPDQFPNGSIYDPDMTGQ